MESRNGVIEIFVALCEWETEESRNMDWCVTLSKRDAVDFISRTYIEQPYYSDVKNGIREILETDDPRCLSEGFSCLEAPSWIIGDLGNEGECNGWSATISKEPLRTYLQNLKSRSASDTPSPRSS